MSADALIGQSPSPRGRRTVIIEGREAAEGEVLVRYVAGAGRVQRERAEIQADGEASEPIGRAGARRVRSRGMTTRQMLAALRANPDVAYAEPNYIIRALAVPNDTSFPSLWGLFNNGQVVEGRAGVPGADIGAVDAWDISTGSRANVVAVLDSGIDATHPDLAANVYRTPRDVSINIGGLTVNCVAGAHGYNALNDTCGVADDNGHGTHVAGIVGAVGNNNRGVTGVNWTASIMALKVLGADGTGTTAHAIKAIDWAVKVKTALGADANVRVMNASWGGGVYSQALNDEIESANRANILFVASAGSDGRNTDVTPHYPASSTASNVVSVASADNTGVLAAYSNWGAVSVDLAAPGGDTLSTLPGNTYGYMGGTSMSAAFVSGAAALVLSSCPSNTATLKARLIGSVDLEPTLAGRSVSGGRLNVGTALSRCLITLHASISGNTITATVENSPGNPQDWLALYCPATNADTAYTAWKYLNNSNTPPSSGMTTATVTFPAPSQPGVACNVRLLENNQVVRLATSETVTTGAGGSTTSLTIGDITVAEGNNGTSIATFTVTASPVNTTQSVAVNYATANGTATAGSDYVASSGTLTFTPSTATQTINVTINGDTTVEPNETFLVNLTNPVNATIADGSATATITNDDAAAGPSVTPASTTVQPGGTIQVTVSGGPGNRADWVALAVATSPDTQKLAWQYLNGTNTPPATGVNNATLQFTAPSTPGTYSLRFFSNDSYTRLAVSPNITVAAAPSLAIGDVNITEGNSGTTVAQFTVTLSPVNTSQTVTVNYATANGTATAGTDYVAGSGTLTFAPSVATQTISVTVNGDTTNEPNETFFVNLSGASNAAISDAQATGTIVTDDAPPGPAVSVASTSVAPGATIEATVSGGPANRMDWVALALSSAADTSYVDWKYLSGTRTAPSTGMASASLQFTAPTTPGTYTLRFFANDTFTRLAISPVITVAAGPTLTIGDITVAEGNSGASVATFTVSLSPVNASQAVTVNYATANGTATAGSDYVAASGTLTFPASTSTQTISVTINGDTASEPNETFLVNLSGATNAGIGDAQAIGTITNDDAAAGPTVTPSVTSVAPGATFNVTVSGGPGNRADWVALVPASAADGGHVDWKYLNGLRTLPASGSANATLQFTAPQTAGSYNLRFFANDAYTRLAISAVITVASGGASPPAPSGPAVNVSATAVAAGAPITVTISGGPGNPMDWVALAPVSAPDGTYATWRYLNGQNTVPATGLTSATLQFLAPGTPGSYEFRFFRDNSYTRLATSVAVTVSP